MISNVCSRALRRLVVTLAAIVPLLVANAVPASASAPSNDDISNATVITTLPFRDVVDISQATFDFATDSSCSFNTQHTVWYTFTPAVDESVAFDPSASNGEITIDVFTGTPGALTRVGCGQGGFSGFFNSGFILSATAGTKYWIMVSTVCCVAVPSLDLSVYLAVAPQATVTLADGTFDRGGNVTVAGTLDCTGTVPNPGSIGGTVRQSVGRLSSVSASFAMTTSCSPGLSWAALAQPSAGRFVGGPATVNVAARLCNIVGCAAPATTEVVTLTG